MLDPHPWTLKEWMRYPITHARLMTTLASVFAGCALLLAALGFYGVLTQVVAHCIRVFGITHRHWNNIRPDSMDRIRARIDAVNRRDRDRDWRCDCIEEDSRGNVVRRQSN
jgi:hypothetical protein